jgi:hypothetical protein
MFWGKLLNMTDQFYSVIIGQFYAAIDTRHLFMYIRKNYELYQYLKNKCLKNLKEREPYVL